MAATLGKALAHHADVGGRAMLLRRALVFASRGAYVASRLVVTIGLPITLGAQALGQFSLFSALITLLPVAFSMGMPEHAARRSGNGPNAVILAAFLRQALTSALACGGASYLWLHLYPEISETTRALVGILSVAASLAANLHIFSVGVGHTLRANVALTLANFGPTFAVALGFLTGSGGIEALCAYWIAFALAGIAINVTGLWPWFMRLRGRRLMPRARPQLRMLAGLRFLWINQLVDLARTYSDRLVLPLVAGFELAGVYAVFALATSICTMIPNAVFGQTDLPRLIAAAGDRDRTAALARAGAVRAAILAGLMMSPLLAIKPVVEFVLTVRLEASFYYPLCVSALVAAAAAAAADYLWYAIYAARAERRLAMAAIATIPLAFLLLFLGARLAGPIGASLAVTTVNLVTLAMRLRVLRVPRPALPLGGARVLT